MRKAFVVNQYSCAKGFGSQILDVFQAPLRAKFEIIIVGRGVRRQLALPTKKINMPIFTAAPR